MDDNYLPMRSLGEVAENFDALRRPVKSSDRRPGPYPYYGAQGIVDYVDGYLFDGDFILVAEDGENLRSRKENIALIARGKFWVNNHAHILKGSQSADTRFIYYAINSADISGYVTGSTIPKLSQGSLNRLPIPCPPLPKQQAISAVLGSLDDKIDLNRRMNETLEAMARAIFEDWFVDFGPVRAKAEGRPPYLAPDLWALFPDVLDDDDKPVGWERKKIEALAELCKGSISPSRKSETLFEHYSLPAFDNGQEPAADIGKSIKSNKTPVPNGAVLLSKLNPEISRVWIPNDPIGVHQIASTEFLLFKPIPPVGRGLLYCLFRDSGFKQMLEGMVTGTSKSHQRISPPALLKSSGLCGSEFAFQAFEKMVYPVFSRLISNRAESRTLAQLRDLLLPKLMSGEIRLRDAEKMVEAVA